MAITIIIHSQQNLSPQNSISLTQTFLKKENVQHGGPERGISFDVKYCVSFYSLTTINKSQPDHKEKNEPGNEDPKCKRTCI